MEPREEVQKEEDRLLSFAELEWRYRKTRPTIYNWLKDPELNFPQPKKIGRSKFFSLKELQAYEKASGARAA